MKKFLIGFFICFVGMSCVLAWSLFRQAEEEETSAESSGVVDATRISLTARVSAKISKLNFLEGSSVHSGDVLAEFDCEDLRAMQASTEARAQAANAQFNSLRAQSSATRLQANAANETTEAQRAQLESLRVLEQQARRESARTESLYKDRVVNEASLEASTSAVNDLQKKTVAAEKAVQAASLNARAAEKQTESMSSQVLALEKQAEASRVEAERVAIMLKDCKIIAPQDGVISLRAREVGESVAPGMLVYELRNLTNLKAKFFIHNSSLAKVTLGSKVSVVADAIPEKSFSAQITNIAEEASFTPRSVQTKDDRDRLVYAAEALIADPKGQLRPGMAVEVFLKKR